MACSNAASRPSRHYPEQLDQFDEYIKPKWAVFPRVISLSDRSRNKNSEADQLNAV